MFLVDFERLKNEQNLRIKKEENLSIFEILDSLPLKSEESSKDERVLPSCCIDLSHEIDNLFQEGAIIECLGRRKKIFNNVYFSSIYKKPEIYHNEYFKVMRTLRQGKEDVNNFFWLEDSTLFFPNNKILNKEITSEYDEVIVRNNVQCNILRCSQTIISMGIPYNFGKNYLRNISIKDILQIMPFHKRVLPEVDLIDILHFCWNLYEIYLFPGIYLAGINSKRNFEIFKRILNDKRITILFLPIT